MDCQSRIDAEGGVAHLRLGGPIATEHAASLAAAWKALLVETDAARGHPAPSGAPPPGSWSAVLDLSEVTGVGLAFFEVTAAAALALSRRGMPLARDGVLPEHVAQAARISGFAALPGLTDVFGGQPTTRPSR
jgi:hypothetical protein